MLFWVVSLAIARAAAASTGQPLWRYIGGVHAAVLPTPMMNILNGGAHADNALDIQEVMTMPLAAASFIEARNWRRDFSRAHRFQEAGLSTAVGDEGGFAPAIGSTTGAAMDPEGYRKSGRRPGEDVMIALDAATTEFCADGTYQLAGGQGAFFR